MFSRIKKYFFKKWFTQMLDIGIQQIKLPIKTMLDTGSGKGVNTLLIANRINPTKLYGMDMFEESIMSSDNRITKIIGDLNMDFPIESETIDLIVSNHTIEHIINLRRYLSECYRVLEKNGQILIMTDNLCSPVNILCMILGWQPIPLVNINGWNIGNPFMYMDETKDTDYDKYKKYLKDNKVGLLGHVYVLSPKGLKDFLRRTGFTDIKLITPGLKQFIIVYAKKGRINGTSSD